jgi:hypothetical protein
MSLLAASLGRQANRSQMIQFIGLVSRGAALVLQGLGRVRFAPNGSSVSNSVQGTIWKHFTFHTMAGRIQYSEGRSMGPRHRICRCCSNPATIFTGIAPREALVDSRLILRWSRMPNWSSNASREMALPGRSLCVATRAAYSISAIGSPAIAPKPRTCRRKFSFGFTGRLAVIVRRTADLQPG